MMREDKRTIQSIIYFRRPFRIPGFEELLPAGSYEVETEVRAPEGCPDIDVWKESVLLHLHPRMSHPGLARSLTVSIAELEEARALDDKPGQSHLEAFLDEMLTDPIIQLIMEADSVSEPQLRSFYRHLCNDKHRDGTEAAARAIVSARLAESFAIDAAENEGMPAGQA
ncbi:hypothetical protein [Tranquillimonas rosea]|uniref:hypothetical protein n=1 Tax=Tranquillimonas rosea TaxID=641238 RepID=UPI003BA9ECFC